MNILTPSILGKPKRVDMGLDGVSISGACPHCGTEFTESLDWIDDIAVNDVTELSFFCDEVNCRKEFTAQIHVSVEVKLQ